MRRFSLEQIHAFLAVVRRGGVGKAADSLNLTQPAVTTRIRKLEEALGVELFDRTSSGVRLTKRGELLIGYAEKFERLEDLVEQHIAAPDSVDRLLRLGVSETIAQCWLPDFVSALHHAFPKLEVEINVDISVNLRAALLERQIDLAILLGPVSEFSVENRDLPGFHLSWYVAADQPLDGADLLRNLPVITYARHTRPYRELKRLLHAHVGNEVHLFPSSTLSACFRLVETGLGVAALPVAMGEPLVASGSIRDFDPGWKPAPLRFTASFLGEPPSHVVARAADIAQKVARNWLT